MTVPRSVGRWLVVARVVVALFALGIFAVSITGYWMELQRVCHEGARACAGRGFLTRKSVEQVEALDVSVRLHAANVIALRVLYLAVWVAVGAVIFWRKSEDRMALLVAFTLVTFVGSQIHRYRRVSGPEQRQQTKWVIFGTSIGFGGFLVLVAVQGILPGFAKTGVLGGLFSQTVITVLFLMIPLAIGVAICSVVALQYVFRAFSGEDSQLAIVASTLAIAALFNPLRRRLQSFTDQLFYRRKYDASRILAAHGNRLREEVDLRALSDDLLEVVGKTVQPVHASLWSRPPDGAPPAEVREA